ncbi:glycosyltransferase family 2 protein, partial [Hungatella sp.]|uniref:glycosyltransferase family 2 protein n=1 Tax=Hungatella sp. TaxID=2613924 RepID=UPI003AB4A6AE
MEFKNCRKYDLPFITALIVCRNEEDYIKLSLGSLLNQDYPDDRYEILIIDGLSTDQTIESAEKVIAQYKNNRGSCPQIGFYKNKKMILAAGWNIGIKNSKGELVFRIDAHSTAAPDYIKKCVETILKHDAICVGGKIESKSLQGEDDVITKVLSSPFGVGNSSFRVSNTEGYTDTAVYGLYRKSIFEEIGYFDETLVRNQDIELHARIKNIGGKFYFNPEIHSVYYTRNTVKKMLKQAYQNGKWNPIVQNKNRSALSLRHMVPFLFVLFVCITSILGFLNKVFWYF